MRPEVRLAIPRHEGSNERLASEPRYSRARSCWDTREGRGAWDRGWNGEDSDACLAMLLDV
jgi:hypothetical protein